MNFDMATKHYPQAVINYLATKINTKTDSNEMKMQGMLDCSQYDDDD